MPDISDLSEREIEILKLVAGGASNKQIAHTLTISTNTVKVHLRNIFNKIEVASRTEAAMFAVRQGLVEPVILSADGGIKDQLDESLNDFHDPKDPVKRLILVGTLLIIIILVLVLWGGFRGIFVTPNNFASSSYESRWREMDPMLTARAGFGVVVYENQIYTIGGETNEGVTSVVELFSPSKNLWNVLAPKPLAVTDVGAALVGGKIFVPGGRLEDGSATDVLAIFDPRQEIWSEGQPLPIPLYGYALTAFEGKLILFGGKNDQGYLSNVFVYDPSRDSWSEGMSLPTARAYAGAAVAGGKIFVIGGFDGDDPLQVNEVYIPEQDDGKGNPWGNAAPMPEGRYGMGVAIIADIIYVIGGKRESDEGDYLLEYFAHSNEWVENININLHPNSFVRIIPLETKIYVLGGRKDGVVSSQVLEYQAIYTISIPVVR
jgi:DNA-binding CsgD family transcriptional regulator/N-acetylneuraminic acid mutarotase